MSTNELQVTDTNLYDEEQIIENCGIIVVYEAGDCKEFSYFENDYGGEDEYYTRDAYEEMFVYHNCTVQIWSNSATGKQSIGWWKND